MSPSTTLAVDFGQGISDAWSKIATFVPKLLGFLVILLIGWFVSRLIAKILDRGLRKVGFEKVCERAGTSSLLRDSEYDGTGIVTKVVYYALLLMTLQLALGIFGPNPVSSMINSIVAWLPRGLVAVVIIVVAMAIANAVRGIVGGALSAVSYGKTVTTAVWAVIVALGVIAALGQAGIATSVSQPVLIAALASVTGVLVVGVGGGLIAPMRQRWERWLDTAEREGAKARDSIGAYQAGREDAPTQDRTDGFPK